MRRARRILVAAALCGLASGAGCDRILGVDGDWAVAPGASSTGATGGAASGGAGGGGAGGAGGAEVKDCTPDDPGPFADGATCPLDMVDAGTFCIDAHEASFGDYLGVVDRHALSCFEENLVGDATCVGNEPFNIEERAFRGADDDLPAHPLDYCDAETYCRLRGRTLCTSDEWRLVCSPNFLPFPWGGESSGGHCIDHPYIEPVDREPNTCRRNDAITAVVDMPGNVAEHLFDCADGVCGPCQDQLNCIVVGARLEALDGGAPPDDCNVRAGAPHRTGLGVTVVGPDLRVGVRCCYHPER